MPKKITVLVRKGELSPLQVSLASWGSYLGTLMGSKDEYEEKDNPNYPQESYEEFISNMINLEKLKIQKVLDLI